MTKFEQVITEATAFPQTYFVEYIRDRRRNKIGVLAVVKVSEDTARVGWSQCAYNRGDKFDPVKGKAIAFGRAYTSRSNNMLPAKVAAKVDYITERAKRYFKVSNVEFA